MSYSKPSISNYNASPPPDDASQISANVVRWSNHITKIGDPLKSYIDAVNNATESAWNDLASTSTVSDGAALVGCKHGGSAGTFSTGAVATTVQAILDNLAVSAKAFGAVGSGDETTKLQAALDYCATNGRVLRGDPGVTYTFSTLRIKNGTKGVDFTRSVLRPNGSTTSSNLTTEAAIVLDGPNNSGTAVDGCVISLNLDMQNGDRTAILGDACTECVFINNRIYGFTNDATNNHRGIRIQHAASRNLIVNNFIQGFDTPTQRGLLIDIWCRIDEGFHDFGGFFSDLAGTHTGSANASTLTDSAASYTTDELVGMTIYNITDGSKGTVTANTSTTVTATLAGGTDNDWDASDVYSVGNDTGLANTAVHQAYPAVGNIIANNQLLDGSYAVQLQGCEYCVVSGNYMNNQNHRSVYVAGGSWHNIISENQCREYKSTAVLLGYGAAYNSVVNNVCITSSANIGGQASINVNSGSRGNYIAGNQIDGPVNHGVYISNDSSFCVVENNYIRNHYLSAIQIDNDWIDTRPTNSIFSSTQYDDPDTTTGLSNPPASSWTFNDLEGVIIKDNTIGRGYPGRTTAAIGLAQIENDFAGATATDLKNITIANNVVQTMDNIGYCIHLFEHVADQMSGVQIVGNSWPDAAVGSNLDFLAATPSSASVDFKTIGVTRCDGNGVLDDLVRGTPVAFTDADTTPDVSDWTYFNCANTGSTSITDFGGASEGKEFVLRLDTNTTIVHDNALVRLQGGSNITGRSSNDFVRFKSISGVWFEIHRSW